jgi:hypothetical protein
VNLYNRQYASNETAFKIRDPKVLFLITLRQTIRVRNDAIWTGINPAELKWDTRADVLVRRCNARK